MSAPATDDAAVRVTEGGQSWLHHLGARIQEPHAPQKPEETHSWESLSRATRRVITIASIARDLRGRLAYDGQPYQLEELLAAGMRGAALEYIPSLSNPSDEHSHGTHVAGIVAGNAATGETDEFGALYGLGVAPGSHIVSQRIFDGLGQFQPPPSFETLTRDAVTAGADIGNNSWGEDNQGSYDMSAMEFDALVRDADALTPGDQPYILEFSAGNSGPGTRIP